jgi:hypothetical protein
MTQEAGSVRTDEYLNHLIDTEYQISNVSLTSGLSVNRLL